MTVDLTKMCEISNVVRVFYIVKILFKIVCILVPIILIIVTGIDLFKNVISGDKLNNKLVLFVKRLLAGFIIFLLPGFIEYIFTLVNFDSTMINDCYVNASLERIKELEAKEKKELEENQKKKEEDSKKSSLDMANKRQQENKEKEEARKDNKTNETESSASNNTGKVVAVDMKYNVKDPEGRCGKASSDKCVEVATVTYQDGSKKTFYMGRQNNYKLLAGSCRAHAFTCGMNAVNDTKYSTLDLQNYMKTIDGNGVFKGEKKYNAAISHFNVPAKAYFNETSISQSVSIAKKALDNGQPVIIFVSGNKCSDLAQSHHALLLLGYDSAGNIIFMDSCGRYRTAKKRTLNQLGACMSGDAIAKNWMRMVVFE